MSLKDSLLRLFVFTFTFGEITLIVSSCQSVGYSEHPHCAGRRTPEPPVHSTEANTSTGCAVKCEETFQCISFFYDQLTCNCSLYDRTLQELTTETQAGYRCFQVDDVVQSWAVEVMNVSSSYYSDGGDWALGANNDQAWAQGADQLDTTSFIELRFTTNMYIERITIYEKFWPGGITDIKLITTEHTWTTVWSNGSPENLGSGRRIWSPKLEVSHFRTCQVRFDIGQRGEFEGIDAVQITGRLNRIGGRRRQ